MGIKNGKGIGEAALKSQRVVHADVRQATPAWTNTNRVNKANQFTPRPVQLSNIRPNLSTASKTINTVGNVNTGHVNVSTVSSAGTQNKSGSSRFNTGKHNVNSGSVHVNSGTQIKSGSSRFNTGKQNVNSGSVHVNTARVNRPDHPLKHMEHRGIIDEVVVGHSSGNGAHLEDYQEIIQWDLLLLEEVKVESQWKRSIVNARTPQHNGVAERRITNPAGSKEVIDIDVQTEEAADLMVVSSTSLTGATRKAASADDFRPLEKDDALALKHLGPVPATAPTSTNPVNTGSDNLTTGFEEVTSGNIEAISPSDDHERRDGLDCQYRTTLKDSNAHPQVKSLRSLIHQFRLEALSRRSLKLML
ncbi:hypothetical protein Tco_0730715 [Tanacetum coccineum]